MFTLALATIDVAKIQYNFVNLNLILMYIYNHIFETNTLANKSLFMVQPVCDSVKISVPLSKVLQMPSELYNDYCVIDKQTGEIDNRFEELNKNFYEINNEFFRLKFSFTNIPQQGRHLTFILTSGICHFLQRNEFDKYMSSKCVRFNFTQILDYLKEHKFIFYPDFLDHSHCSDLDICQDFHLSQNFFNDYATKLQGGVSYYTDKILSGYQYSSRRGATNKRPFAKVYNKHLYNRSKQNSAHFFEKYPDKELFRIEVTIKNSLHFDYLNRRVNSGSTTTAQIFKSAFFTPFLHEIYKQTFYENSQEKIKRSTKPKGFSYTELFFINMMTKENDFNYFFDINYQDLVRNGWIDEKSASHSVKKTRLKEKIKKLFES